MRFLFKAHCSKL